MFSGQELRFFIPQQMPRDIVLVSLKYSSVHPSFHELSAHSYRTISQYPMVRFDTQSYKLCQNQLINTRVTALNLVSISKVSISNYNYTNAILASFCNELHISPKLVLKFILWFIGGQYL